MFPYFIFKGIDSRNYLTVNKSPSIFKPEKDIAIIEIDGRDGFLTQDNGTYKSITKEVECTITDLTNIDYICSWLTGSGDIVFSNQLDRTFKATIVNKIEFARVFKAYRTFIIQFECQPFGYDLINNVVTKTITPATLSNSGTVNSKPLIKVYGTGSIDLTINSTVIHLTNVVDYVTIDSELMDCYKGTVLKNNYMTGDFPELIPGVNNISWTGTVTKIEITPNFKYL